MESIKMVDLNTQMLEIKDDILKNFTELLENTEFINGRYVKLFEKKLAEYLNVKHVIGVANGTDAIQISLMALGLQEGDEVIVPTWTYVATAEVIALLKLKPLFVDVALDNFNIKLENVDKLITPKTKAIVPVHLYGQCSNMDEIMNFAKKYNLYVVEDNAQSIGSIYNFNNVNKFAGTIGDIGTTSFFPSKNLGCYGDGGAIFTNDDSLARIIRAIADHGQLNEKYYHDIIGVNSRLDSMQAIVLNAKLPKLNQYIESRQKLALKYNSLFESIEGVIVPKTEEYTTHVFHQYTLRITNNKRTKLKEFLLSKNIPCAIYYPLPLHYQNAFKNFNNGKIELSNSELLSKEVLSLPMHTHMSEPQFDYIKKTILEFFI